MHGRPRLSGAVSTGFLLLVVATACTGEPAIEAAPAGGGPACAQIARQLPERVLGKGRVPVDAAGAAAWGDPAIVLRCGLPMPGPTSDPCLTVNDVDWLYAGDDEDDARFITYGRDPAVEVVVPQSYGRQNAAAALPGLATALKTVPASKRCVG